MAKDAVQLIKRFPVLKELEQALADRIVSSLQVGGSHSIALSGGNTPKNLYRLLAARADMPWDRTTFYLGDERYVPPTDERSNEHLVRSTLFSGFKASLLQYPSHASEPLPCRDDRARAGEGQGWGKVFHGIYDPAGWQESAAKYREQLPDHFTLAIQGLGDDGHTASVFPDTIEQAETVFTSELPARDRNEATVTERITISVDFLSRSEAVIFLVAGRGKAQRVREAIQDSNCDLPGARLARMASHVEWWIDEEAASLLN